MSQATTIRCDGPGCGRIKQESNHWFKLWESPFSFRVFRSEEAIDLDNEDDLAMATDDLCGPGCVQKRLDAWLSRKRAIAEKEPQTA